jgi:hypothetical protein
MMKLVLVDDAGDPVAEIEDVEHYDLSTMRGRATLIDEITLALGQADRRRVLEFIRHSKVAGPSDGEE